MQVLYTILYILLFIFCLSVLVLIHELGHFSFAKFFKVYVKEFSIGFGPQIFKHKKKNGETTFSLRAVPFGGYVAMYGEGEETIPGIDDSRRFDNLKRWKKIIILFAGVFNNAILALILFFISNSCFPQQYLYLSYVDVKENSIAEKAGISDKDYISLRPLMVLKDGKPIEADGYYYLDENALITYQDNSTKDVFAVIAANNVTYSSRSYDTNVHYYAKDSSGYADLNKEYTSKDENISFVKYNLTTAKEEYKQYINSNWIILPREEIINPSNGEAYFNQEENVIKKWNGSNWVNSNYDYAGYKTPTDINEYYIWLDNEAYKTNHDIALNIIPNNGERKFEESGLSLLYLERWNTAGEMFSKTFINFGDSATIIVRGLGSLFTSADSWKDVGGIIAIGVQTTNILQNFGLAKFIYIWGLISVNLAIVNLLPFPGLDGWQILVLVVEAVFHKEIPEKIKNVVSFVGIALLFVLMILILIKDVIGLF